MIWSIWDGQRIWAFPLQTFAGFNPQVQLQLAVNPTHTFMVQSELFHTAKMQLTQPKCPILKHLGQRNLPILNFFILIRQQRHIPITTLADINARQASATLASRTATACWAISRRKNCLITFLQRFLHQFILHSNISVLALQTRIRGVQLLHLRNERRIHAAYFERH